MNRFRLSKDKKVESGATTPDHKDGAATPAGAEKRSVDDQHHGDLEKDGAAANGDKTRLLRPYTFALAAIVSIGGFIFGYDTGQISG